LRAVAVAGAAALALTVGACGGSDSTGNGDGTGKRTSGGTTPTTLAVDIGQQPANLDPLLTADGPRESFQFSIYEGLTARDGGDLAPALATEWKADGNAYVFTLREGVTFHNGQPLTAKDVVASYERILDKKSQNLGNAVVEGTKVEAVDDMTVSISRDVPDPTTPARATLVMIVPAEYAALSDTRLSNEMVGTGPYQLADWVKGQSLKMTAFDAYWGEKPSIKEVTIGFNTEVAVRLAALQNDEAQFVTNMSADLAQDDFTVAATPNSEVAVLKLNNVRTGPVQDAKVRQAINYAIDKDLLIEQIMGGFGRPVGGQYVADYVFGHNPDLKPYPFDPDKSRALLKEAGYDNEPITMTGTKGRWSGDAEMAAAVVGMLKDVGLNIKFKISPEAEWVRINFDKNKQNVPEMWIASTSNQLLDSSYSIDGQYVCDGVLSQWCQPEIDKLAAEADSEVDQDARAGIYHDIWQRLWDDAAFVSIGEQLRLSFHVKNLEWKPQPDGFLRFQDMKFTG
jgi:peptide/nickel transport system substrate-binding protein